MTNENPSQDHIPKMDHPSTGSGRTAERISSVRGELVEPSFEIGTKVQTKGKRVRGVKIPDAIRLMTERYGPFEEEPRLDPVHELIFTVLSQHTSDINSARAFGYLMDEFGSLEAVAGGDVAEIEKAISPGGLAKVKAPRIKLVLNHILERNGSLDLSFLREMPLQ